MKRMLKTISLVLVLALMLCMCPFAAAQDTSSDVDSYAGFHAPTVRKLIEMNLESRSVDQGFFHLLTNAYLADPELLIETIWELPEEDIAYLAKAIAHDLQRTQRQYEIADLPEFVNPNADVFKRLVALETEKPENAFVETFENESMLSDLSIGLMQGAEMLSSVTVSNLQFNLSTNEAELGVTNVTASISFNVSPVNSLSSTYKVRIYRRSGSETLLWKSTNVTVAPNTNMGTVSVALDANTMGHFEVYAIVYTSTGVNLRTSATKEIAVKGRWHIDVVLPAERKYKGTLTLYDGSGAYLMRTECLGQSVSDADPSVINGNTPTGECVGELAGPVDESEYGSYGPYKIIDLYPVSGDIARYSYRREFMIHGGSPETDTSLYRYPLSPTNGCIRVSNTYQRLLQNWIISLLDEGDHYVRGTVSIRQEG